MLTGLVQHLDKIKLLVNENSGTILTGMGVAGTVTTAYLTGRASVKAVRLIEDEIEAETFRANEGLEDRGVTIFPGDLSFPKKVKLVWRYYIPPVIAGTTTIASIILANRIASKKIVALTVASGISERALQEYKDKVVQKLGERENTKIRDEIAQDRISKDSANSQVVLVGSGKVLCYDAITGRYFESTAEDIRRAENKINREFLNHMYASLSEFYEELGLPATNYTDSVGWNGDEPLEVLISATKTDPPNERPCLVVNFNRPPTIDYVSFHN